MISNVEGGLDLRSDVLLIVTPMIKVAWDGKFYSCKVVVARQSALKVHALS